MSLIIPPGFIRYTFEGWLAQFLSQLPSIGIELAKLADPRSTDAELGPGIEAIKRLEDAGLIVFAENPGGEPALFAAQDKDFPTPEDKATAMRLVGWFDRGGDFDARTGTIVSEVGITLGPEVPLEEFLAFAPEALKGVAESARVSRRVVEEIYRRWITAGVFKTVSAIGPKGQKTITAYFPDGVPPLPTRSEQAIVRAFFEHFKMEYPRGQEHARIRVQQWLLESSIDATRIAFRANVSAEELATALFRFEQADWLAIRRTQDAAGRRTDKVHLRIPADHEGPHLSELERRVIAGLQHWNDPPPPSTNYTRALETQYLALASLEDAARVVRQKGLTIFDRIPTDVLWGTDITALRRADTFCWFAEQTDAVSYAAESMLMSVRATRDLTESAAGWWYFTQPLPIPTTTKNDTVMALLWSWGPNPTAPSEFGVSFSAYVWGDDQTRGVVPMPSTYFFWPEGVSLQHAIEGFRRQYRAEYQQPDPEAPPRAGLMGEKATMAVVDQLSRFWVSGALWLQQKLLVYAQGHVHRAVKRRMEREVFKRPLSDVQIVQLRRRETVQQEATPEGSSGRTYTCRWIVSGHWRDQYYPSKGIHQPKYIEAYPKGPEDMPLKVPSHRIYVVNR